MRINKFFSFIVKNFGFLKSVPMLPDIFDACLRLMALVFKPELMHWLDDIEAEVLSWKGTSTSIHKYGGIQFNFSGKEIGHLHSNGLLDVLYSREVKDRLLTLGRAESHHVFKNTGWISFYVNRPEDREYAKELLLLSYLSRKSSGSSVVALMKYMHSDLVQFFRG